MELCDEVATIGACELLLSSAWQHADAVDLESLEPRLAKMLELLHRLGVTGSDRELLQQEALHRNRSTRNDNWSKRNL